MIKDMMMLKKNFKKETQMKTREEIIEERQKLLNWIIDTEDDKMRNDFVQQSKILEWVLEGSHK